MLRRFRTSYAAVTATLALVFAIGGGAAVAVDLIGSRQIRNDSIKPRDLGFLLGAGQSFRDSEIVSTGGAQTLLTRKISAEDRGAIVPIACIEVEGHDPAGANVQLFIVAHRKQHGGIFDQTVAEGQVATACAVGPPCSVDPTNPVRLKIRAVAGQGDAIFRDRQLDLVFTAAGKV